MRLAKYAATFCFNLNIINLTTDQSVCVCKTLNDSSFIESRVLSQNCTASTGKILFISSTWLSRNSRYTVQSVQSCQQASFHCVQLWQRTEDVMDIKVGKAAPNNEDACLEHHFFDDTVPVQTITGKVENKIECIQRILMF